MLAGSGKGSCFLIAAGRAARYTLGFVWCPRMTQADGFRFKPIKDWFRLVSISSRPSKKQGE